MIQSATIGALSITSTSLQLDEAGVEAGGRTYRRQVATSPFVGGTYETASVEDGGQLSLRVWALGTDTVTMQAAVKSLIDAVSDFSYRITITAEGFTQSWSCYRADYLVGNKSSNVRGLIVPVNLTVPHTGLVP